MFLSNFMCDPFSAVKWNKNWSEYYWYIQGWPTFVSGSNHQLIVKTMFGKWDVNMKMWLFNGNFYCNCQHLLHHRFLRCKFELDKCQILVKHYKCWGLNFIRIDQEHDFIPPVPELHRAVIAGGVELGEVDRICLLGQLFSKYLGLFDPDIVSHGIPK